MTTPIEDPRAEPAEQPATKELPAVPPWAIELTVLVKRVSTNVDNVISAVDVIRDRVNAHDQRFADMDQRATSHSLAVKGASKVDLEQASQLAAERVAREALAVEVTEIKKTNEAQLAILARLDKIASNPTVKLILFALGTIATGYLASKGLK